MRSGAAWSRLECPVARDCTSEELGVRNSRPLGTRAVVAAGADLRSHSGGASVPARGVQLNWGLDVRGVVSPTS